MQSDESVKENIKPVENAFLKLNNIQGVQYNLKQSQTKSTKKSTKKSKTSYGFIAQDLEKIFPDMVLTNDTGKKFIVYDAMIPVLVEAYKNQQQTIIELTGKLSEIQESVEKNKDIALQSSSAKLYQNKPNPFSSETKITYFLPQTASNAFINIYNLQGLQEKSYTLAEKEQGSIMVSAKELKPGMYLYTLIVDGDIVDTRRMIITE